jgi:hypothetical protein
MSAMGDADDDDTEEDQDRQTWRPVLELVALAHVFGVVGVLASDPLIKLLARLIG